MVEVERNLDLKIEKMLNLEPVDEILSIDDIYELAIYNFKNE